MVVDFQLAGHTDRDTYPEWGSAPRRPLVKFDMAHQGEWMESVIGQSVETGEPMVYHIVRCELCVLTHIWPIPSTEGLARYYRDTFYQEEKKGYLERSLEDARWWTECTYKPLLRQCTMHVRLDCPEEDRIRFLDIGSGPGLALDTARAMGWHTTGIEPHAGLCERGTAQGHVMLHGTIDTADLANKKYDVIGLYEVLEHSREPEELIRRCWELLDTNGVLYVAVPSDYNPLQYAACQQHNLFHYWISIPDHINYFTPATLKLLVRRCGFQLRHIHMTYPMEQFLLDGDVYVGNPVVGRACHKKRMTFELEQARIGDWNKLEQQYVLNVERRIGREIVAVFVKQ